MQLVYYNLQILKQYIIIFVPCLLFFVSLSILLDASVLNSSEFVEIIAFGYM